MSRSGDITRRSLRGRKCEECGHAQAAHNQLGYCSRRSRMYGECICPTGWSQIGGASAILTLEDHRVMWRVHAALVRAEDRKRRGMS